MSTNYIKTDEGKQILTFKKLKKESVLLDSFDTLLYLLRMYLLLQHFFGTKAIMLIFKQLFK